MTPPNSRALLFVKVDSLIILWLAEFNFEVVFSILFTNQLHTLPPGSQVSYHAINSKLIDSAFGLVLLAISLHDNSRTLVLNTCDQRIYRWDAMLHFQGNNFFWCLSRVNYTLLRLFLNFLNWTKQQWSLTPITCRRMLITFILILIDIKWKITLYISKTNSSNL
jgi:hypothetical protein